jgi:hypothetical protein
MVLSDSKHTVLRTDPCTTSPCRGCSLPQGGAVHCWGLLDTIGPRGSAERRVELDLGGKGGNGGG